MNANMDGIKTLVWYFMKLDTEYQQELITQSISLYLKQTVKEDVKKENPELVHRINKFKNNELDKKELESKIESAANAKCEDVARFIKLLDKLDDTQHVAVAIAMESITGGSGLFTEEDISITINQKKLGVREYIEKHCPSADYEEAKKQVNEFLPKTKSTTGKRT